MNAPVFPPVVRLANESIRQRLHRLIDALPLGWVVRFSEATRTLGQNDALHGYCEQIAKARPVWAGIPMDKYDWKNLLIEGHAKATGGKGDRLVPSLEDGGPVQLRESSSKMSKSRSSSLLSYVSAWAAQQGIELKGDW